jgi:hypothetical protein
MSIFGVMFTPDQESAAAELMRVCKHGGSIGLANWTPEGFIGQVFKTIGRHVPPPAGARSPALWGTRTRLDELFPAHKMSVAATPRQFVMRYRSPRHWLEVFRLVYGPMLKTFAALPPAGQEALTAIFSRLSNSSTVPAMAQWLCRANISRSSSRSAEPRQRFRNDFRGMQRRRQQIAGAMAGSQIKDIGDSHDRICSNFFAFVAETQSSPRTKRTA